MNAWWLFFSVAASTLVLSGLVRHYSLSRNLLDIPNERSSHEVPTPRGGGVAIVIIFLITLFFISLDNRFQPATLWAVFGAGAWIALVGFIDDHRHVPASWRLFAHFIGAIWALTWLQGLPPLPVFGFILNLGWFGHLLAAVYLVWLINLYNFMDGINGLASIEAATVCLGGVILFIMLPTSNSEWTVPMLLLASVLGFLFWNFPHAKIFMGDVGSGFLGIVLGILSIQAARVAPELFWAWLTLLGVFIVDATVTLIFRFLRGEQIYEAHRSHAYQWSARKWGHTRVTLSVLVINLLWLFPMAAMSLIFPALGPLFVVIAFLPLTILALKLGAGNAE